MKKRVLAIMMAIIAFSGAQAANKEVGISVGNWLGLTYKQFITDNFAVQTDLGWGVMATQATIRVDGEKVKGAGSYWNFSLNPNALYHIFLDQGFYVYGGGGLSLGLGSALSETKVFGNFGVNADLGAGYDFESVPITLTFDFRPGYGLGFDKEMTISYFDWKLALGVRYRF